jgi:predicted glycosyltransferase
VLDELGLREEHVLVVVRTPPDIALYHRSANTFFPRLLERLGRDESARTVVVARTAGQRESIRGLRLPSLLLPKRAVDAQSLIALSDLVVSAGGTMNREAVALGVPVYTTFGGRIGAVDEELILDGRLERLDDPTALELRKRDRTGQRVRRDPERMLELLLSAVAPLTERQRHPR